MERKNLYDNRPRQNLYEVADERPHIPKRESSNDTNIILRCKSGDKESFKSKAKAKGKTLSKWIIETLNKAK